jgi:hypothetical protein
MQASDRPPGTVEADHRERGLFNLGEVPVSRYHYRGAISNPWV